MDLRMYDTFKGSAEASDLFVLTRATCRAYDSAVAEYSSFTDVYENFPGLKEELVACGTGRDSRFLAQLGRQVVAADYSPLMLDCASKKLTDTERQQIAFARCHMVNLPFVDNQFGGTWASASLLHLPSLWIPQALSEIFRTLLPGGRAGISMRAGKAEGWREGGSLSGRRWFTLVEPKEFSELMSEIGYRNTDIRFSGREDWFIAIGQK
jgi:SAM-dependent methyltransferase